MKKLILAAFAAMSLSAGALAQGHQGHADKGSHGGPMQDVVGVHAELLLAERTLTVHLYGEDGKPVPSAGYSASALIGTGQARQVVQLTPSGENVLTGTAPNAVARGTSLTLQVKAPGGRTGQARF
ncbi:hypothetical protein [Roseomonas chloroacetimidivorans]|jgi:hypothetical protein|uniref:hypothetical protein n=1 Tax=Roseomonas chloroacetimidivorans TaxID=1766656 RepID=UPI003C70D069